MASFKRSTKQTFPQSPKNPPKSETPLPNLHREDYWPKGRDNPVILSGFFDNRLILNLDYWILDGRMRILESLQVVEAEVPYSASKEAGGYGGWLWECHGIWHSLFLIIPSTVFLLYLAFQAKKSVSKLSNGRSHIIIAYYAFLWIVSLLNLLWCSLQVCFRYWNFFDLTLFLTFDFLFKKERRAY